MAYAIAAVAWDTADSVLPSAASSGVLQRVHGNKAFKLIDRDLLVLMQTSTLYSFATVHHATMLRHVFLRRALQGCASVDEVYLLLCTQMLSLSATFYTCNCLVAELQHVSDGGLCINTCCTCLQLCLTFILSRTHDLSMMHCIAHDEHLQ